MVVPGSASEANVKVACEIGGILSSNCTEEIDEPTQREDGAFFAIPPRSRRILLKQFELPLLLAGSLFPAIGVWFYLGRPLFTGSFVEMSIALIVATTLSWYVLAQLKDHANSRHLSYVLPINLIAFSSALALIALLRIPYSGSYFATGAFSLLSGVFSV